MALFPWQNSRRSRVLAHFDDKTTYIAEAVQLADFGGEQEDSKAALRTMPRRLCTGLELASAFRREKVRSGKCQIHELSSWQRRCFDIFSRKFLSTSP